MEMSKKQTLKAWLKSWLLFLVAVLVILGIPTYYVTFLTPKNSLELYQAIAFAEDFGEAKKLMQKEYEGNFREEDFEFISGTEDSPKRIGQLSLFEYDKKTFVIMTSPGTSKLEVLAVDELPKDVREYFLELGQ